MDIQQSIQTPLPVPSSPSETPKEKRGILFEVIFVVAFLAVLFAILNYSNILPHSKLFPDLFGFLPHKNSEQPEQNNNITTVPTITSAVSFPQQALSQQAKETLLDFLPTILSPSLVPQSSSTITFKQNEGIRESFSTLWDTKEGTVSAIMVSSSDGTNISQMYLSFLKPQSQVPTVELAQTTTSQFFSIQPKGKWGCKPIYVNTMTFCENFWEEEDGERLGLGIIGVSPQESNLVFFCQHNKDSKLYSWKSCQNEFAETGVQ